MGAAMAHLRKAMPEDAIICNGAGNFSSPSKRRSRTCPRRI